MLCIWQNKYCIVLYCSCNPEQHKQFCKAAEEFLCPLPVPDPLPEPFEAMSVVKEEDCLVFGRAGVLLNGFFLFPFVSAVGMATTPANPGSFLIAACRLTSLARSVNLGVCPLSLMEYDTSAHLLIK